MRHDHARRDDAVCYLGAESFREEESWPEGPQGGIVSLFVSVPFALLIDAFELGHHIDLRYQFVEFVERIRWKLHRFARLKNED